MSVSAYYFDGISTRRHTVSLSLADGWLAVRGDEVAREEPFTTMSISEKLGNSPRLLHFPDGSHCEVNDHAAFEALLSEAGYRPQSLVSRLEGKWRFALSAFLLSIACVIAGFIWGLPWVAQQVAASIPHSVARGIDEHALRAFDDGLMQPSKLDAARQQQLSQRFTALHDTHELPPHTLKFRSSPTIGANAFALPGGTIVVTDELVALAANDEEIIAVLAHEMGHVSERHPLRQLLQSSVVALAMTWYLGDISSLLAAAPTLLLQTSYSREFERRSDRYAARLLSMNGIPAVHLADMLEKLEAAHPGSKHVSSSRFGELFSTHPDTGERIRLLREETPTAN